MYTIYYVSIYSSFDFLLPAKYDLFNVIKQQYNDQYHSHVVTETIDDILKENRFVLGSFSSLRTIIGQFKLM